MDFGKIKTRSRLFMVVLVEILETKLNNPVETGSTHSTAFNSIKINSSSTKVIEIP